MAVKTKPRYRGTPYKKVKWNPVCEMPEFADYLEPTFDVSEKPIDTTMYQEYKPWWQRIINRLLLLKR